MEFQIVVTVSNVKYHLNVKRQLATAELERYEVRAKNHIFLFDVNRPALIAKAQGHLPWTWNQMAGTTNAKYFLDEIKREIEKVLRREIA